MTDSKVGPLLDRLIAEYSDVLREMGRGPVPTVADMAKGIDLIGVEMRRLRVLAEAAEAEAKRWAKRCEDGWTHPESIATELNDARNAVRIYGDHLPRCEKRPCTCGFQEVWDDHAAKATHPGKPNA